MQFSHKGEQGIHCEPYLFGFRMFLSPGNSLPSQTTKRSPESFASSISGLQNKYQLCAFLWPAVCSSFAALSLLTTTTD